MSHLQFMPGDHQLVDQLVYELKSKGIFDQFRKECFADVDTKPAYQNLRQRVESSVQMFLSRQTWRPDLNKNQLREKLRKHILDGNYLEQGVNRIVDQVVNPKIASVFIPQVEELFYNHLGIQRPKPITPATEETSNGKVESDLLPTDLEAVSPGSVKSNDGKEDGKISGDNTEEMKMDIDDASQTKSELKEESQESMQVEKAESQLSGISDLTSHSSESVDNSTIPLPSEIKPENIPPPEGSPPKFELDKIELPKDKDIPLPETSLIPLPETDKESIFKPINLGSEEDSSSSDSSLIRNMSPLTPVRNFDDENSCDAQQGFDIDVKADDPEPQPASFRFTIEANKSSESSQDAIKNVEKKDPEPNLSYQFESQVNLNTYNTPLYEESSNSNNLQIDYESDVNSKTNTDVKLPELDQSSQEVKKEKAEEKKSHKSSHRSRDSHRHSSSSKDRRSDSKTSSSRDKDAKDKKSSSKVESSSSKTKPSQRERSRDRSDKKDSRDSSKHRSSAHKSSSSSKDTKHRSSSSSQRHSSSKHDDKKTSSSSSSHKDKSSSKDYKSKDSKSSSHKSDKDRKSSSSRKDEKDKDKKEKKETDDHYSLSGRGNINRRSTDRDSNDGNSSSSKGSNVQTRNSETNNNNKKDKSTSSKSETTSTSSGTSPCDKEVVLNVTMSQARNLLQAKSAVRVENHLETPLKSSPVRFIPEVVLKKPKFASNFEEAKKMMKMRKFMHEEQRRMNQEAALLLEFQANVRPSMSQVYSNISGPELEFACGNNEVIDDSKESNNDTLIMEEVSIEDFVIAEDNKSDTETIESLADIQKEVDEFALSDEIKDDGAKEDVTRTSDELLKDLSETEESKVEVVTEDAKESSVIEINRTEDDLKYFNQTEKYNAEIYRDSYSRFLKSYTEDKHYNNKLYLINCNNYEEDVFRNVSHGEYEIVSYHRNGHSCPQKSAKHVDFNNTEITIPLSAERSPLLSPVKSECSFELSSDYDARLEDMMHTTSRQQIMEIILGGVLEDSPTKMPKIDICSELSIESSVSCKRTFSEIESSDNNNRQVLTPNKIRKISSSDQISSTTEENDEAPSNHVNNVNTNMAPRSKYLGKAKRIGLPRPRKPNVTGSPSSDKSVENYEQNSLASPPVANGRLVKAPRNQVQRYDTSDLYKPKLHYLSRRNNVT